MQNQQNVDAWELRDAIKKHYKKYKRFVVKTEYHADEKAVKAFVETLGYKLDSSRSGTRYYSGMGKNARWEVFVSINSTVHVVYADSKAEICVMGNTPDLFETVEHQLIQVGLYIPKRK